MDHYQFYKKMSEARYRVGDPADGNYADFYHMRITSVKVRISERQVR